MLFVSCCGVKLLLSTHEIQLALGRLGMNVIAMGICPSKFFWKRAQIGGHYNLEVLGNAHRYPSLIFSVYDLFHEKRYKRFPRISVKKQLQKIPPQSRFLAYIHFNRTYLILLRTSIKSTSLEELFFAFWHCKSEGLLVLDYPILVSTAKKKDISCR